MACAGIAHGQAFGTGMRCRAEQADQFKAGEEVEWLLGQSRACKDVGAYTESAAMAGSAMALAMRLGDAAGVAEATLLAGMIDMDRREWAQAELWLTKAHDLGRKQDCPRRVLMADIYLAVLAGHRDAAPWERDSLFRAVDRAKQLGDTFAEARARYYAGLCEQARGEPRLAWSQLDTALTMARAVGDEWLCAVSAGALGILHGSSGRYAEAIPLFREALDRWTALGNPSGMADSYHRLGNVHFYLGDYQDALAFYMNALAIRKEVDAPLKIGESYHDIGHIYFKQGNFEEALDHYSLALSMFREAAHRKREGQALGSMGNVYTQTGRLDKALEAYEGSIRILEEIGDQDVLVYSLNNIGKLYLDAGHPGLARARLATAKAIARQLEDDESLSLSYYNLALVEFSDSHMAAARSALDTTLAISVRTGSKDMQMWGHYLMARVDSALARPASALAHFKLYKLYADSLQAADRDRLHAEMKARFESEQKEEALLRLAAEQELQADRLRRQTLLKNILLGGLGLLLLLGFFVHRYLITRQKLKIQVLRNRIAADLHDEVGSTLSSIAIFSEIAQQRSGEVKPMLQTIHESARKMLEAMTDIVWTIHPDNDQFEQIILRMRNYAYELLGARGIEFDFSTDDDMADIRLPMDLRRNLFLIFKEATNNMLKYADADRAVFQISTRQGGLSMVIRDNGKGFDPDAIPAGNGLRNMRRRAEEVGGTLAVESAPGLGTTVRLSIARY